MAHVTEKIKCSDFPHLRSELTFQETEEEVKPVKHLSVNDEAEFFHEVDKDESRIDFALEVMDGHSGEVKLSMATISKMLRTVSSRLEISAKSK